MARSPGSKNGVQRMTRFGAMSGPPYQAAAAATASAMTATADHTTHPGAIRARGSPTLDLELPLRRRPQQHVGEPHRDAPPERDQRHLLERRVALLPELAEIGHGRIVGDHR